MKKTMATLGILLTMAATAITGTTLPVSAYSAARPARMESWSIDDNDDYDDYDEWQDDYSEEYIDDGSESWNIHDSESWADDSDTAVVSGTKHYLGLRKKPAYSDSNIIGKLYNGDEVIMTDEWSGDYVKVYSPDYDCYGWVNANYLDN